MRKCIICKKEKEDESFIHDKYAKGGIKNVCLECNKERARNQRATIKKHIEELEKKLNDYVKITSISIDMSTEEAPYNRIYAKPIEKQGDVLLCEFESANYDIKQKNLKEENTKLKELLRECSYRIDWRIRTGHKPSDEETQKLFDKISQVLGEK